MEKNNPTREERLRIILQSEEETLPENLNNILYRRDKVVLGSVLTSLASLSKTRGMYAHFVKNNDNEMRQHFHVGSQLTLASIGHDGGANFEVVSDFLYPLLSDSPSAIDAFSKIATPELTRDSNRPITARFHVYMLQLAIRDENLLLAAAIKKIAENGKSPWRELSAQGRDFYSLLLARDKFGLERLIQEGAVEHKQGDVRIEMFLSGLSTIQAKICWLKGIPVEIDSPWVPMRLMPVCPLAHYDDEYEFLKPGWVPPSQGIVGKFARWFK
jgi:hypothetical protein